MRSTKKVKLNKIDLFYHYGIVFVLLIAPIMVVWNCIEYYVLDTYTGVRSPLEMGKVGLSFLTVAILFFLLQRKRLKFKEFKLPKECRSETFELAFESTVKQLDWKVDFRTRNFIRAHRNRNGIGSWGEMITIIRNGNQILINSICDPTKWVSVSSFRWNKTNVDSFIKNLNAYAQQEL